MFAFLTSGAKEAADPLSDPPAADAFWRILPKNDPITAQKQVCRVLADLVARDDPNTGRLRALLTLDRRAQALIDALLVNYVRRNRQPASLEAQSWQAAFELCRSFGSAHGHFLRSMRDNPRFQGGREYLPHAMLRFFQHRQTELLLRPFAHERSTRFSWRELHEAYRFARSCGLLPQSLPVSRCHSDTQAVTTLEREYIQVLLQELMNDGQLPPHDAFWASQRMPRWCEAATLRPYQAQSAEQRFVVDQGGDAGLVRRTGESAVLCRDLDTAPILASIQDEIAALRDARAGPGDDSSVGRGQQLKLLRKLNDIYAPGRPMIERRGERKPTALTVEVAVGMAQILRKLRNGPEGSAVALPRALATNRDEPSTVWGGFADTSTGTYPNEPKSVARGSPDAIDTPHPPLTMVDQSDSGCRLHGPTVPAFPIMPGLLIAFREDLTMPWTLAVVRRVKKRLAGRRVEIGVEYVGRDPRWIVVVVPDSDTRPDSSAGNVRPRFAAIYLPESAKRPTLPIKTLVLPADGLVAQGRLSVRSRTAVHTIHLRAPLEEQNEFIWSPFDIVDRWLKDEPASAAAMAETR